MAARKIYKMVRDGDEPMNIDQSSLKYFQSQGWQVISVSEQAPVVREVTIPQAVEEEETEDED